MKRTLGNFSPKARAHLRRAGLRYCSTNSGLDRLLGERWCVVEVRVRDKRLGCGHYYEVRAAAQPFRLTGSTFTDRAGFLWEAVASVEFKLGLAHYGLDHLLGCIELNRLRVAEAQFRVNQRAAQGKGTHQNQLHGLNLHQRRLRDLEREVAARVGRIGNFDTAAALASVGLSITGEAA